MGKKINGFIYWTPRILGIIFILFLAMFSLDVFEPGLTFWPIVIGLFIHNIPALLLLIILIISWKHEIVGGIVFILAGVAYIMQTAFGSQLPWYIVFSWSLTIAGPAFLVGILFIINWRKKLMKTDFCTIYFVRHGESKANVDDLVGITSCSLSSKGKKQAEILSKNLKGINFETIYSSEFERAKETAKTVAKGCKVKIDGRLNEWNIGRLDGVSQSKFDKETNIYFDKNNKLDNDEKFKTRLYPEMETPKEVAERMNLFIREIAKKCPGKNILAVTHAAALGFLLIQLKRLKFEQLPIFGEIIPNTSFVKILCDGDKMKLFLD